VPQPFSFFRGKEGRVHRPPLFHREYGFTFPQPARKKREEGEEFAPSLFLLRPPALVLSSPNFLFLLAEGRERDSPLLPLRRDHAQALPSFFRRLEGESPTGRRKKKKKMDFFSFPFPGTFIFFFYLLFNLEMGESLPSPPHHQEGQKISPFFPPPRAFW